MKKIRGKFIIIIIIISILLFFMIFISKSMGYSTNDYTINIPSNYKRDEEGNFSYVSSNSLNNIGIEVNYFEDTEYFKYTQEFLDLALETINNQNFISYGHNVHFSATDSDITTFGKDKYKCFFIESILTIKNIPFWVNQYLVISGNYAYTLTIMSSDADYLKSSEVKNIVNSFEIYDFRPVDDAMYYFRKIISVISCVVVFVLIIILLIKIVDSKRKKYKNNPINFDEYNVGNSSVKLDTDNSNTKKIEKNKNIDFKRFCYINNCAEFIDLIQNKWSILPYYNKDNKKRIVDFNDFHNLKTDTAKVIFIFNLIMDVNDSYTKYRIYISTVKIIDENYLTFSNSMLNEYSKLLDELKECIRELKGKESFAFFENVIIHIYEDHLKLLDILKEINKIIGQQLLLNASQLQITFVVDKLSRELMEVTDKYADNLTKLGTIYFFCFYSILLYDFCSEFNWIFYKRLFY